MPHERKLKGLNIDPPKPAFCFCRAARLRLGLGPKILHCPSTFSWSQLGPLAMDTLPHKEKGPRQRPRSRQTCHPCVHQVPWLNSWSWISILYSCKPPAALTSESVILCCSMLIKPESQPHRPAAQPLKYPARLNSDSGTLRVQAANTLKPDRVPTLVPSAGHSSWRRSGELTPCFVSA